MPDSAQLSESPEPPDPPEWAKSLRWIWHHIRQESAVIRRAPAAAALTAIVMLMLAWFAGQAWYGHQIADLVSANTSLTATNDQLREELKGASPQLAALQARRQQMRKELLALYVEGGKALDQYHNTIEVGKMLSAPELEAAVRDEKEWEVRTEKWLEEHLGEAAKERFIDVSGMPYYSWLGSGPYDVALNRLVNRRKNLATLIETSAYDK